MGTLSLLCQTQFRFVVCMEGRFLQAGGLNSIALSWHHFYQDTKVSCLLTKNLLFRSITTIQVALVARSTAPTPRRKRETSTHTTKVEGDPFNFEHHLAPDRFLHSSSSPTIDFQSQSLEIFPSSYHHSIGTSLTSPLSHSAIWSSY